jgi:hypothetical protein
MARKTLIKLCTDLAVLNRDVGALFVIDFNKKPLADYYTSIHGTLSENGIPLSIYNPAHHTLIRFLAAIDGATILNMNGELVCYGATLNYHKNLFGHGKRHAFALGTSELKGITCILSSEEDKHIRVFENGRLIRDFNPKTSEYMNSSTRAINAFKETATNSMITGGLIGSLVTLNPLPFLVNLATVGAGKTAAYISEHWGHKKKRRR